MWWLQFGDVGGSVLDMWRLSLTDVWLGFGDAVTQILKCGD